jgi:hypothetical protein
MKANIAKKTITKVALGKIKDIPIDSVRVNPLNKKMFKRESAEHFSDLMTSMREKGQMVPIIVKNDGVLIAGENRLNVAKALGWTTIKGQEVIEDLSREDELSLIMDEQFLRRHLFRADRMRVYAEFFPNFQNRLLETRGQGAKGKTDAQGNPSYAIDAKEIAKKTGIKPGTVVTDLRVLRKATRKVEEITSPIYNKAIVRRVKLRCTMITKALEFQKPATIARAMEYIVEMKKNVAELVGPRSKKLTA